MEYSDARQAYNYPTSHIRAKYYDCRDEELIYVEALGNNHLVDEFRLPTTLSLDTYHNTLLNSDSHFDIRLGIASVIYWGTYFNKGVPNPGLAESRTKKFLNIKQNVREPLLNAKNYLLNENFGMALHEIVKIKRLGIAFGSKVLSFMSPDKVGVYDVHISRYFNEPNLAMDSKGYLSQRKRDVYDNFCMYLNNEVYRLNSEQGGWIERDGQVHTWRAVDVERACFYMALNDQYR